MQLEYAVMKVSTKRFCPLLTNTTTNIAPFSSIILSALALPTIVVSLEPPPHPVDKPIFD